MARTDEEIAAYTLGDLSPHAGAIVLHDHDPAWRLLFEREAARVRATLGDRVKLLEHAGSTSVDGLPAKPVIDMVLAVPDSSAEPVYVPDLEGSGYVLRIREPNWFEHRMFKGPDTNINLHVFSVDCSEIEQMLLFRDWLRAHPEDRDAYAAAKRDLAGRTWRFVQDYADAKSEIVQQILARARASSTNPGG